ncbi:MAG: protein-tyrosine phosphatase [Parvicellaceae bacterium]|jgi:protein-tyrosine phosphatase
MAHGIMRHKSDMLGLNVVVDSAGTSAYHVGDPPDSRQQATASQKQIEIGDLRARQFSINDYSEFDLIYAMDQSNYDNILALARTEKDTEKVKMILNESNPGKHLSVPDPYYGGDSGFELVFDLLNDACSVIAKKIQDGTYR